MRLRAPPAFLDVDPSVVAAARRGRLGRVSEPRDECLRCGRPKVACWCSHVTQLDTKTRVVLLQHPRERRVAIGTARMANMALSNSELHVGVDFHGSALLARLIADRERPLALLYPGEGAIDVAVHPPKEPITLIVVDGTWPQARKLVRRTPELAALPRYTFVATHPSEYRIRKEPDEAYVSTIESLVYVLGALEGDAERFTSLLAPFRAMVDNQVDHIERIHTPRKRLRRPRARWLGPPILRERSRDLVCVAGEASARPFGERERGEIGELVHWVACRPETGETFEAIVRPELPIAPATPYHVELSAERMLAGIAPSEFRRAWAAFVRPTDVLCSWGDHPREVLAKSGAIVPSESVDVRAVVRILRNQRVKSLDALEGELGPSEAPMFDGRGGRRLTTTTRLTRQLLTLGRAGVV